MREKRNTLHLCAIALLVGALLSPLAWAALPKDVTSPVSEKAFFLPELYISTSHQPLEDVLGELPNKAAWDRFGLETKALGPAGEMRVYVDPRSGAVSNLMGAFPLIPGDGVGNTLTAEDVARRLNLKAAGINEHAVIAAVVQFVVDNQEALGVNPGQLGQAVASMVRSDLWQVSIPQSVDGVPVRYGRLAATISHGNLVTIGTELWGNVGISTTPQIDAAAALDSGFGYVGGRSAADSLVREPVLEIVPTAVDGAAVGQGYGHRLAWSFVFVRPPEHATWQVTVDAVDGSVLALEDINHYGDVTGGVYPITNTEICPTPETCGTLESGWPMPFADTGLSAPNAFTNSGGVVNSTSNITTNLDGVYVRISDTCGAISESGSGGTLDLGGANGDHDCDTPVGASSGNTASSRSAYYELTKLNEQARGWLPNNTWLQGQITSNVNINSTCNAFYSSFQGTVNFYRSGGGCRNTGEIAGVFDHEWGHALDDNDAGGSLSNTSEAYADLVAIYRLETSCVGHGFFWTSNRGCGTTADGTGFNANEAQTGAAHCDLDCSGVRDADWDKHADHTPDTPLNFVCPSCSSSSGPCGRQVHCAAAPPRQAAWDLVARDLPAAGFDRETSFAIGNKLFYQGSGNIGTWYSCTCGSSSSGCGATNAYMQWIAADDDNGNLNDGTPHMAQIFAAFDRHGIACSSPTPQNGGCGSGPASAPGLVATAGDGVVDLDWTSVTGASEYWVFRTEGVNGCNFGKALIGKTAGLTFSDTGVQPGRTYYYNVAAAGSSEACFSDLSTCQSATPTAPPPPPPPSCELSGASCTENIQCCSGNCKGKPGSKTCK